MTRADLDYLINGIVNGLGGSGSFGGRYTGGGSSPISRGVAGRDISGADFDRDIERRIIQKRGMTSHKNGIIVCTQLMHGHL